MTENKDAQPMDWLKIAKLAGEHGVRYQTNARLEAFLAALSTPQPESVDDVRAALAEAIEALRVARSWFGFYARNHRVAGKLDKAARNQQLADMTAQVVAKYREGRS